MRGKLVVANWKMNGSMASITALLGDLTGMAAYDRVAVAVCAPYVYLPLALNLADGMSVGGQDCSRHSDGAYTAEVSAAMLADIGCTRVIVGHSERREYHGESDALIAAKLQAASEAGLLPILCVGETREQRESGAADAVVSAQLRAALEAQSPIAGLSVAYEPVWAIGTGLTASPEQAQAMHANIRSTLGTIAWVDSGATSLLYGGSVKQDNAAALFAQPDIDGALVGGAALDAGQFKAIVEASQHS